ncbi:hypothetical protein IK110_01750 [Candidatus Saccharibacteria bacterium]|nr:hypothetical protein [Candidatus Saccharibacteria bacterium]
MDNYSFDGENSAAASPAAASSTPKKQGGKILLASFIALLAGGAIASAIFLTINNFGGQKGDKSADNCERNTLENIAIQPAKDDNGNEISGKGTILDARLTAELAYKTNRVLANKATSERNVFMDSTGKMADYVNLSDDMKTQIVMQQVDVREATKKKVGDLPEDSDARKDYKTIYNSDKKYTDAEIGVVNINDAIKSDYKYLFDGEIKSYPDIYDSFSVQACFLNWDSTQKFYYTASQCGGGTSISHSLFQYKYLLDGEKAYVYVAIGSSKDGVDSNSAVFYSGFSSDLKEVKLTKSEKASYYSSWYLGVGGDFYNPTTQDYEPYYKYVQHYRAVFEKGSDGDFYYKTLEKVDD